MKTLSTLKPDLAGVVLACFIGWNVVLHEKRPQGQLGFRLPGDDKPANVAQMWRYLKQQYPRQVPKRVGVRPYSIIYDTLTAHGLGSGGTHAPQQFTGEFAGLSKPMEPLDGDIESLLDLGAFQPPRTAAQLRLVGEEKNNVYQRIRRQYAGIGAKGQMLFHVVEASGDSFLVQEVEYLAMVKVPRDKIVRILRDRLPVKVLVPDMQELEDVRIAA